MYRKINITLPEQTAYLVEQMIKKGNTSKFVEDAIEHLEKIRLRKQLKPGAVRRAERDLKFSQEWNELEDNAW